MSQRIGWFMSEKKVKQLGWETFIQFARGKGHSIDRLDLEEKVTNPLAQGKFDILLLKMTDELVRLSDPNILMIVNNAKAVIKANPQAVVIDPLESQALTIGRESMHKIFVQLNEATKGTSIHCPDSAIVNTPEELAKMPKIKFPSLQAAGALEAHEMGLIWKTEDFSRFETPFYVQEYLNHNATIFKVYVMGKDSFVVIRKSIPNFELSVREPVMFNSQDWKHELPPEFTVDYAGKHTQPPKEIIDSLSQQVSKLLGLTLFGYDVISDINTGKHAVIDVNYFPGFASSDDRSADFKGVDDVFGRLLKHILDIKSQQSK